MTTSALSRPRLPRGRLTAIAAASVLLAGCAGGEDEADSSPSASTPSVTSSSTSSSATSPSGSASGTLAPVPDRSAVVATDLDVPWALAMLPDGSALLSLRDEATVLRVREGAQPVEVGEVPGVEPGGEGGLLGLTLSPDFATDQLVYAYYTGAEDNRVVRMTYDGNGFGDQEVVFSGIPKNSTHNGGRIKFGPDGMLYIGTGDAQMRENPQDRNSPGGKILRVTPDGEPAPDNPFPGSPVFSLGHRNVQGLTWDADGNLWASEFGQNTWDELNLITPGGNYGWPEVEGQEERAGFVQPQQQWSTDEASPSGVAVDRDGVLWMAALRGESLWRIPLEGRQSGEPERELEGEFGRLRDVVLAPDGRLWILTNNTSRDGAGEDDDQVLVRSPASLG